MHPIPCKERWGHGGGSRRVFTCACGKVQAGSVRGLELVPAKRRYLIPPTSPHQGATRQVTQAVRQRKLRHLYLYR